MSDFEWFLIDFLQALAAGLMVGGTYALMCMGLGIIFGVMRVVNFAQGDFMMLGMYFTYYLFTALGLMIVLGPNVGPIVAALLSGPIVFGIGWLLHRYPDRAGDGRARGVGRGRRPLRPDHPDARHRARAAEWRPHPVRLDPALGADAALARVVGSRR